jgi:putative FmdB family regulatory protein
MPIYTFKCEKCGSVKEFQREFSEEHPAKCPQVYDAPEVKIPGDWDFIGRVCGGELRRIYDTFRFAIN